MNLKILASLLTIGIAVAGTTYGTFAFFSDTETATGNLFTAGDLDLTLNGVNGVTGTIGATNFAPGDSTSGSVLLRNEGSIVNGDAQGHLVDLDLCAYVYDLDDPGTPLVDVDNGGASLVTFSKWLDVTTYTYGSVDLLASIGDEDGDGRARTLHDVNFKGGFTDLVDPGAGGQSLQLALTFNTGGPNYLKRDVSTLTFRFYLAQADETDHDCAANQGQALSTLQVYSNDFTGGAGALWSVSGTDVAPATSNRFLGQFDSHTATLALAGLPAHSTVRIQADLYIIRSWDGESAGDSISLSLDGAPVFASTFAFGDGHLQCYPAAAPCGSPSAANTGAFAVDTLGYVFAGDPADAIYRLSFDVPHTASTAAIAFQGLVDDVVANEAWGLDNVKVTVL